MEIEHLTAEAINSNIETYVTNISKELRAGFEFLRQYPKSVSIFGSARASVDDPHYTQAEKLAERIVSELGYTIITGGGPGIMEAAGKGAQKAKGLSLGLTIHLPTEQKTNKYVEKEMHFEYFFNRKTMLTFAAEAYVFFPGGFGTFDELFSILTLIQTRKIPRVPVVLIGTDYWTPFKQFIEKEMLQQHHAINPDDAKLFILTDDNDVVINIIKKAPISEWWTTTD